MSPVLAAPAAAQTCGLSDTLVDVLRPVTRGVDQVVDAVRNIDGIGGVPLPTGDLPLPSTATRMIIDTAHDVIDSLPPVRHKPDAIPPPAGSQPPPTPPSNGPRVPPTGGENVVDPALLARGVSSLCSAVNSLGIQSGITVVSVSGFTGAIMGRLDSARGATGASSGASSSSSGSASGDGMMGLGATQKHQPAPPAGAVGPLTVYASGTLLGGSSSDMPNAVGFSYAANAGIIGLEYSASRNLTLGAAASFARMETDLNSGARTDADLINGAVYMSYSTKQLFVDALAAYGVVALDMTRPGANETVHGSTDVAAVGLAARAGYLFDLGKARVGPIAGLAYIRGKVGGYTETGNDPTAMSVAEQTIESLTGSVGIRVLAPFQAGTTLFVPYVNVTLEHQFGDSTTSVTTSLTQAPGAPVALSLPTFGARDYGKVEGGITVELSPEASMTFSGASSFARDDGHDYRLSAGLNYRF